MYCTVPKLSCGLMLGCAGRVPGENDAPRPDPDYYPNPEPDITPTDPNRTLMTSMPEKGEQNHQRPIRQQPDTQCVVTDSIAMLNQQLKQQANVWSGKAPVK